MGEDVKPETIKGTQDILGKFIKKPILTEKLLKKPPFRFLHDICTSAMKETGFFSNVITEPEDMIENIKDKEGKIAFLQKVIAAVEAANGIKLGVKPSKIVAGLEATKTNEFLQSLGKALKKQVSDNKNSKINISKTKSTRSHSKETKQDQLDKKQSSNKSSKPNVESGVNEPNEAKKKKINESHTNISPRKPKHSNKKIEEGSTKQSDQRVTEKKMKDKVLEDEKKEKSETDLKEKIKINEAGESVDLPKLDGVTVNGVNGEGDQSKEEKQIMQDEDLKRKQTGHQKHKNSPNHNHGDNFINSEIQKEYNKIEKHKTQSPTHNKANDDTTEKLNVINKSENASQEQSITSPSPMGQPNYSKGDTNLVSERTGLISRPRTSIRPTTARPASARPAAPRIKERNDVVPVEERTKITTVKINVIIDKELDNEAEDDNLISMEAPNDIVLDEIAIPVAPVTIPTEQNEHGHLVEQILEVQKELEDDSRLQMPEHVTGKTEIEWELGKTPESAIREMEKLRSNIQMLTRSANPLGKLLDFFQEDIESIQKELEIWKNKNSHLCIQIAHEKSITEQFVEPLKIHLKEIQESINEQCDQISLVKANIIRNNQKIQKLLVGV